jgi:hypothetical protein
VYCICLERDDTCFEATLPVHSSGYAPQWNAPTLHTSVQDQRYGVTVPYDDVDCGYGFWADAQQSTPFAHMTAMVSIAFLEYSRRPKYFFI